MLDLPDNCIIRILELLPYNDRKTTRLVCKKLLQLNNAAGFDKLSVTIVPDYRLLDDYMSLNLPNVYNLKITIEEDNIGFKDRKVDVFWTTHGYEIESLEILINAYNYHHKLLREICRRCRNLECLNIRFKDYMIFQTTRKMYENLSRVSTFKLRSLHLSCFGHQAMILKPLLSNAKSLKSINISTSSNRNCKDTIVDPLKPLINGQLTELFLKSENLAANELEELFDRENKLRVLQLRLKGISFDSMRTITENSKSLEVLRMNGYYNSTLQIPSMQMWNAFFSKLFHLTHVALDNTVNYSIAIALRNFTNLTCLKLSNCRDMSDDGIICIFGTRPWPKMRHLNLSGLNGITDNCIERILPNLPNISILSLKNCSSLTYAILKSVYKHNLKLRYLTLFGLNLLSDLDERHVSIPGLNNLTQLIHLGLSNFPCKLFLGLKLSELRTIVVSDGETCNAETIAGIFLNCLSLNYVLSSKGPFIGVNNGKSYIEYLATNRSLSKEILYEYVYEKFCNIPRFLSLAIERRNSFA